MAEFHLEIDGWVKDEEYVTVYTEIDGETKTYHGNILQHNKGNNILIYHFDDKKVHNVNLDDIASIEPRVKKTPKKNPPRKKPAPPKKPQPQPTKRPKVEESPELKKQALLELKAELKEKVEKQIKAELEKKLTEEFTENLKFGVEMQLRREMKDSIKDAVEKEVRDELTAKMKEEIKIEKAKALKGINVLDGVKYKMEVQDLIELTKEFERDDLMALRNLVQYIRRIKSK